MIQSQQKRCPQGVTLTLVTTSMHNEQQFDADVVDTLSDVAFCGVELRNQTSDEWEAAMRR